MLRGPLLIVFGGLPGTGKSSVSQALARSFVCSEPLEHRRRVESRSPEIAGHVLPIWEEVIAHTFEPWTGDHLVLNTAMNSLDDAAQRAETYIIGRSLRVAR